MTYIIGITGGIASGKSTVTSYLLQKGYRVIDADQVVHRLQKKGGLLYQVLLKEFGSSILQSDGELNRKELGKRVFEQEEVRKRLSLLQDDIIRKALLEECKQAARDVDILFMDIPLLFELGYDSLVHETWLLVLAPAIQRERLMQRNQLSFEEARQRLAAQMPLAEKMTKTPYHIDNNGDRQATYQQIDLLLQRIERR